MAQSLILKVKGLYTNSNQVSEVPDGALSIADNIVINRDSIAESRRGMNRLTFSLPLSTDRADKVYQYQNTLLVHYNNNVLAYYNASTGVVPYAGSYSHPDPLLGRIKSAEANQNFYFTSTNGIQKLDSVTGTPTQAGMYKGLDSKATAAVNASGFMANNTQVAYRVVWGITDANSNLVLGFPSQRAIIANTSGGAQDVSLQTTIPAGITVNHFFQVYRSNQSASSATQPDDNMQLVYQASPTAPQIAAKSVTITDSVPESLKGAALYTNDTQQGILQANELPPYAYDMAVYKDCLFFGNTRTKQKLQLSILAVGGSNGIAVGDTLTVAGTTYTAAAAENAAANQFQVITTGSPSQNINDTALSLVRVINQSSANILVYAYYVSTPSGLPGQVIIEERILGGAQYYATATGHPAAYFPNLPTSGTTVGSANATNLNGLMFSKQQIPDAVPSTNILYLGSASKKILRILALRDSLFVMKEDGVYRVSGTSPSNFSADLLDNTAILLAPESAVQLNNRIFALTTQGVAAIADTGVEVLSRPIEDQFITLFGSSLNALRNYSFGVGYESDRKYILWTVGSSADTYGTQAFVYNVFTKAWTRWIRNQAHAIVLQTDDKIYAVDPTSKYLNQERKDGTFHDFADETIPTTILSSSGLNVTLVDASNVSVGDLLYQSDAFSSIITAVNLAANIVTVTDIVAWVPANPSYYLKSISCTMEWVPNPNKNPGVLKQWSEVTLLTKQNYYNTASINFYSDVSGGIEFVPIAGQSNGAWGRFPWGTGSWGGVNRTLPTRVYVPLEKQRCDLLSVQFVCRNTWSRFQIEGLSLVNRPFSTRVMR